MFENKSYDLVDKLVESEYRGAKRQHGETYDNSDLANAVLCGEIGEADAEMDVIKRVAHRSSEINNVGLDMIESHARLCILECAQVIAVTKKYRDSKKDWK